MKYFKYFTILLFSSIITLYSCKEKTNAPKNITPKPFIPTATTAVEPPQNAVGTWHYTCLKGCSGGAGSSINCATCGTLLVHNQAYHANANNMPSSAPFATPTAAPKAEPSQNSAGIWHYTCQKGCAGGSGSASNCGTCGNTLAHNGAYHL